MGSLPRIELNASERLSLVGRCLYYHGMVLCLDDTRLSINRPSIFPFNQNLGALTLRTAAFTSGQLT